MWLSLLGVGLSATSLGFAGMFLAGRVVSPSLATVLANAQPWSPAFVVVSLILGLLGTALAFTLWFSLLHRGELTRLNTFTFLTPVIALVIGMVFFSESLSLAEMTGRSS